MDEQTKIAILRVFLRTYGVLSFVIFVPLCLGIIFQIPQLGEGGPMNWAIWNGVICGGQPCYVPPMLFVIYLTWAVFLFRAAEDPRAYASFLDFTIWANLAHGLLMAAQSLTDLSLYWSKWLTDIPFITILAVGIFMLRPARNGSSILRDELGRASPQ